MSNIKEIFNKKIITCIIVIAVLIILKQLLVVGLPIEALIGAGEDDALMVNIAKNILDGNWLGTYSYHTLMKGPMFPLFLALIYKLKLPYIETVTILYTLSCIVFLLAIKKDKLNGIYVLIFAIMLFNPIIMCTEILQRVYRNSLIPSMSVFIISSYIAIFLRSKEDKISKLIPWLIIVSISLPVFYYLREDSMWILPFIIFVTLAIFIRIIVNKNYNITNKIICLILIIIPIVSLKLTGEVIARKNEKEYGMKIINVLTDSSFADALNQIYSVRPQVYIDRVNLTNEKSDRLSTVSPYYNIIHNTLKKYLIGYNALDSNPDDWELEDGWILWALRSSAIECGFDTLEKENVLWTNIANEIYKAIQEGKLETQITMPSPMMSPWRKTYTIDIIKNLWDALVYSIKFEDVKSNNIDVSNDLNFAKNFRETCHGKIGYIPDDFKTEDSNMIENNNIKNIEVNFINYILKVYSIISPLLAIFSAIYYIIITFKMIKELFKKKYDLIEEWTILSGTLGAFFTLIVGIAYNHTCTADSIKVLYLCGVHSIYLAFCSICIYNAIEYYKKIKQKKYLN